MVTLGGRVLPVMLQHVKTGISLPDDLFQAIDARARALRLSRSGLIARATREFLEKPTSTKDAADEWNRVIAAAGQPGDDGAAAAFRKRSKAIVRRSARSTD